MKTYKNRVARKWRWWAISTIIVLFILLSVGYAFLSLEDDVGNGFVYMMLIGGSMIVASFVLGQAVHAILVKSWDTYVGDLGPVEIDMLIPVLQEQKRRAKEEG